MLKFIIILGLAVGALAAQANVQVTSIQGASNFELLEGGGARIYGGFAGECAQQRPSPEHTCNSCLSGTEELGPCNEKRVHTDLYLRIYFQASSELKSSGRLIAEGISDGLDIDEGSFSPPSLGAGGQATYSLQWSKICSSSSCADSGTAEFNIGVDADGDSNLDSDEATKIIVIYHTPEEDDDEDDTPDATPRSPATIRCDSTVEDANTNTLTDTIGWGSGICSFEVLRGDGKAFLDNVVTRGDFPDYSIRVAFEKARVYFVDTQDGGYGYTDITYKNFNKPWLRHQDIIVTSGGDWLSESVITGLTNKRIYAFKVAMIDQAQNIAFLTSDEEISATPGCSLQSSTPVQSVTEHQVPGNGDEARLARECPYTVRPEPVHGFLSDEKNCFIATAALGSRQAWQLQVLRNFRDKVLTRFVWGQKFIKWYYKYGPAGARWLHRHPIFKPLVRMALWPVALVAWSSLQWMGDTH